MKKSLLILFLFAGITYQGISQNINAVRLDSLMNVMADNNKVMGSLAIIKHGKVVYTKATGFAAVKGADTTASASATRYRVGSITKMFTSVMIFQLIEAGKLSLETPLGKFYPKVANAGKITIGQMLGHRSGIFSVTSDSTYESWLAIPQQKQDILNRIYSYKPVFEPGEKAEYSNSNFILLGYIIEDLTGKKYAEVLREKIAQPLGLKDTYYGSKPDISKGEAQSYSYKSAWVQEDPTDMSIPHGAGAIVSTASDIALFLDRLFAGKLISAKSLSEMTTITDRHGLGIFQFPFGSKKGFGHSGGIDGFVSNAAYFPDDSLGFAILTNGTNYRLNDVLIGILSICYNVPYDIPVFGPPYTPAAEDLNSYSGTYATDAIPLKIKIWVEGSNLYAQGTNQPAFILEPSARHQFRFDKAGVRMEFHPEKGEMTMKQGPGTFAFKKEAEVR